LLLGDADPRSGVRGADGRPRLAAAAGHGGGAGGDHVRVPAPARLLSGRLAAGARASGGRIRRMRILIPVIAALGLSAACSNETVEKVKALADEACACG